MPTGCQVNSVTISAATRSCTKAAVAQLPGQGVDICWALTMASTCTWKFGAYSSVTPYLIKETGIKCEKLEFAFLLIKNTF